MFNVRLAGDDLYGKWQFNRLLLLMSFMMSLMMSYIVLSFLPLGFMDEIWDKIESVAENCFTYSFIY